MRPEDSPATHSAIRLADYRPPAYLIDRVRLSFDLDPAATRVRAILTLRPNPALAGEDKPDLVLDGAGLTVISAAISGAPVAPADRVVSGETLTVAAARLPDGPFEWVCETELNPAANTALEGLYVSGGMFCTQCEAEGFRKITWFPDRPDVMAVYDVRIEADKTAYPVLLSNGEPTARGDLSGGRHFVEWRDPHPKPCYLFALVAGELAVVEDAFTTQSGAPVKLQIFVRPGDEDRCGFAMESLKHSMRWDETAYGREYDLSLFMIVAVDDFNMGAMENKGLNIFNSKLVLASPESATDGTYEAIESVIAHEYFHNWTGNRVTCRDWFQLCLKEGLTVFRDQQFSADMRSKDVQRIQDVLRLRAMQFREDSGPLAHAVRPESYIEINNFYTATVYEKGAEVIRMLRLLVGPEGYRKALDLYFDRHDGQACTIEDFAACFEEACGRDLSQFKLWWSQAGTPRIEIVDHYDAAAGRLTATLRQHTPPTPRQPDKRPLLMPALLGVVGPDGAPVSLPGAEADGSVMVEVTEAEQTVVFDNVPAGSVLSAFRGFSAPGIVTRSADSAARAHLLAYDSDSFNRWEAGRELARDALLDLIRDPAADAAADSYAAAISAAFRADMDPAFKALLFATPPAAELARAVADQGGVADPDAIHKAQKALSGAVAATLKDQLIEAYHAMAEAGPFSTDHQAMGRRSLRGVCLALLAQLGDSDAFTLAAAQFDAATNMTESLSALAALHRNSAPQADAALHAFYTRWRGDELTLDGWRAIQAQAPREDAAAQVARIAESAEFNWKNPNRFRSLYGAFAGNHWRFHAADGSGYDLVSEALGRLDKVNPQTAARMTTVFESWRLYEPGRNAAMRAAVERLLAGEPSRDMYEIATRILGR